MTGNALLSLKKVNVGYKTLTGTVYAANDINLDLRWACLIYLQIMRR